VVPGFLPFVAAVMLETQYRGASWPPDLVLMRPFLTGTIEA
jgi:hypothetical protein